MVRSESSVQDNPRFDAREAQNLAVAQDPVHIQKINIAITEHIELLALLVFRGPLSGKDIRDFIGISKATFHRSIKRLIKLGVLVQIKFEHNTLYVINGRHTKKIHSALNT